jgi:hypothetical protein
LIWKGYRAFTGKYHWEVFFPTLSISFLPLWYLGRKEAFIFVKTNQVYLLVFQMLNICQDDHMIFLLFLLMWEFVLREFLIANSLFSSEKNKCTVTYCLFYSFKIDLSIASISFVILYFICERNWYQGFFVIFITLAVLHKRLYYFCKTIWVAFHQFLCFVTISKI